MNQHFNRRMDLESDILRIYQNKDPLAEDDIQFLLKSCNRVRQELNDDGISDNSTSILLHLVARCFNLRGNREKMNKILLLISDSPIFGPKGYRLLVGITCTNKDTHSYSCVLKDFVNILHELYERMPNICIANIAVIGLVEFLTEQIKESDELDEHLKNDLTDRIQMLSEALKTATLTTTRRVTPKQDKEEEYKPTEDFRDLPIIPSSADLLQPPRFLWKNKKIGKYVNLDHYLDVQFRLYREDCFRPLRDAVVDFLDKDKELKRFRLNDGLIYRDVIIDGKKTLVDAGEVFIIKLDKEHCQRINWFNSSRLIYGSLLLLSFDRFKTFFLAIVAESDKKELQKHGRFAAQIYDPFNNQDLPRNVVGIMIETTSAYFEAYKYVLQALQTKQEDNFPFQKYIALCQKDVDSPAYIPESCIYDLAPITEKTKITLQDEKKWRLSEPIPKTVEVEIRSQTWPSCKELHMDESQREAFISALTKEFVLIQGPPGCGKTYLGLQIAKALLHNCNKWQSPGNDNDTVQRQIGRPTQIQRGRQIPTQKPVMLVVCYTNHALDQFVEGIIDFLPSLYDGMYPNVVRFGSRSKNEKVSQMSLSNARRRLRRYARAGGVLDEATNAKRNIKLLRDRIEAIHSRNLVLSYTDLKDVLNENHKRQFGDKPVHAWFEWLHTHVKSWYKEVEKQYQNEMTTDDIQKQLTEIIVDKREETIKVVSDAEHAYNERYLEVDDDETHDKDQVLENGKDLDQQLDTLLKTKPRPEKKCLSILRLEKTKACKELHSGAIFREDEVKKISNVWQLKLEERWKLYRYLVTQFLKILHQRLRDREKRFNEIFADYKRALMELDEDIIQNTVVIAMTTTTAARYSESLNRVGPVITIIEEAAEVPEAHIITAINQKCQHLILIGDHCQLEPKPAVYELALHYNLSLSLFERMVNNNLSYHCLQRQHRMRPEISALVRHIYPVLDDNDNVKQYEPIKGVCTSLFFISHNKKESFKDEGKSYCNVHEAEYLRELCLYLIKQGYKPSDITIIAAYSGQLYYLKDKMPKTTFDGVNICVLDNYQGEENEIVLLSLVRSNEKGDIGFLDRQNRICVALSRAKKGMYIIGNSATLGKRSKHWKIVLNKLQYPESQDSQPSKPMIGNALPLYCQNHRDEHGISAELPEDFKKAPDGGCHRPCEIRLVCGHSCRLRCHPVDQKHENYKCIKPCNKRCVEGHICERECHFDEECECKIKIMRTLKCGHKIRLWCHLDYSDLRCQERVPRTLTCGHTVSMPCYDDPLKKLCDEVIDKELPCGHTCPLKCHIDKTKYKCLETVREMRKECGHELTRVCHDLLYEENIRCETLVTEKRSTCDHIIERACFDKSFTERHPCYTMIDTRRSECGHEYKRHCWDTCYETKNPCQDVVSDEWPTCGHTFTRPCYQKDFVESNSCETIITDIRPTCGHQYTRTCSDVHFAERTTCLTIVTKTFPECGHTIEIECFKDISLGKCLKTVEKKFECKHSIQLHCFQVKTTMCTSLCGQLCRNGHLCNKPCHYPESCNCQENTTIVREQCKHEVVVPCSSDSSNIRCSTLVDKTIDSCGHSMKMACSMDPTSTLCTNLVVKNLHDCGHDINVECSKKQLEKLNCTKEVNIVLECGHQAAVKCHTKASGYSHIKCNKKIQIMHPNCGHLIKVPCSIKDDDSILWCTKPVDIKLPCGHIGKRRCDSPNSTQRCNKKCGHPLPCGHTCSGDCHICRKKQEHKPCTNNCGKELVCGHVCGSKKCMECKPCHKKCDYACNHTKCKKSCNDPCTSCTEKCSWSCTHLQCTKLCYEECDRLPCAHNCTLKLKCDHACPGYCSEPCPKQCFFCRPGNYTKSRKNEKVITLEECGHSFGAIYFDKLMKEYMDDMKMYLKCPKCQCIVNYHPRYNATFKRKKEILETIKKEIRRKATSSHITFPICESNILPKCQKYIASCATFIHIIQHIRVEGCVDEQLEKLNVQLDILSNTIKVSKMPIGYLDMLRLFEDIVVLHTDWVLCLAMSEPQVLRRMYPVTTRLLCDSQEAELTNSPNMLVSGETIVETVTNQIGNWTHNDIEKMMRPIVIAMKDNVHMQTAGRYPKADNVVGVHCNDWEVCEKGHIKSTIFQLECKKCMQSSPEPELTLPTNTESSQKDCRDWKLKEDRNPPKRGKRGHGRGMDRNRYDTRTQHSKANDSTVTSNAKNEPAKDKKETKHGTRENDGTQRDRGRGNRRGGRSGRGKGRGKH